MSKHLIPSSSMFSMELEFSTSSFILTSLLLLFFVLNIRKRSKHSSGNVNLPPGPRKFPIIGNLHQLGDSLPHHCLRDFAKKYGPLLHLQLGELSTVVVSSAELAEEVMKTKDVLFATRSYNLAANFLSYNSTDIIFAPYGDYWRHLRKISTLKLLSKKQVQYHQSVREEELSNFVNWIGSKAGSPVNLTDKIYSLTNGVTVMAAIGKKYKDRDLFISIVKKNVEVLGGFNLTDLFPSIQWITGIKSRLEKLHQVTDRVLENVINEHIQNKQTSKVGKTSEESEDLVDVLLNAQEDSDVEFPITKDNIKAVVWDVFSAGTETSGTTINWVMSELMKNPKAMEKVQAEVRQVCSRTGKLDETSINEMKYFKAVIKENFRLHPPSTLLDRECRERCVINGFDIPVKTKVTINVWAIGRDPKYWIEPESFVPERFLDSPIDYKGNHFQLLPFGGGRRICAGISFGMATVELTLAKLLYHFDWKLPNEMKPEDLNMTEAFGITTKRKDDLCLIPIPYLPSAA